MTRFAKVCLAVLLLFAPTLYAQITGIQFQNAGTNVMYGTSYFKVNFVSGCTITQSNYTLNVACSGGAGTITGVTANSPLTGGGSSGSVSIGLGTLTAGANGLANSATTDTTNASNISSGTLNAARLPGAIPIANVGSAGLSGVSPVAIASSGAISLQNSTPANVTTAYGTDTGYFTGSGGATTSGDIITGDSNGGIRDSGSQLYTGSTTVGSAGIWATGVPIAGSALGGISSGSPASGTMWVVQLYLEQPLEIGHSAVYVVTGQTGATYYACLYNASGTSLLWSANAALTSSASVANASASQYLAQPGTYLFGQGQYATGTAASVDLMANTANAGTVANTNGHRFASSSNSLSTGPGCPSGVGTLTNATSANQIMATLEP